jgi:SAM-dependent methyltransferase
MDKYAKPFEMKRRQVVQSMFRSVPFEKHWQAADLGAGIGFYADIIKPRVADVVCLDMAESKVKTCRAKGYPALCHNLDRGLPFEDAEFDFVNALEVIEHLENPAYFLQELKRIIRPHQYLLISTLNRLSPEGWKGKLSETLGGPKWNGWDDTHRHLFIYPEVVKMMNRHFEILNIIGYYFGANVLNRNIPPFLWRLNTSNSWLRRFGFYTLILARNS